MFKRLAALVFLLLALALLWPVRCLTAKCEGKLLFAWPIRAGERFEITFTHSLNLSPITDVIEWTGGDLVVIKSIFSTFGAGVPVPADGAGTELLVVDGHYELIGIDKHMRSIPITVQEVPKHRITLDGREALLTALAEPGKTVVVSVKPAPLAARLLLRINKV